MRRATLACASVLLLAGLTAGCSDDSKGDAKDDESTSSSPSATEETSPDDAGEDAGDDATTPEDPTPSEGSESPAATIDPANQTYCDAAQAATDAKEMDALGDAVADLLENLPDDASDEARAGLEFLKTQVDSSTTQEQFVDKVNKAGKEDSAAVTAYGQFEDATCPSSVN